MSGVTQVLRDVPATEQLHYHEYYGILEGDGVLEADDSNVELRASTTIMVEPGKKRRIVDVERDRVRRVIMKEHSIPVSKHMVT